jgi:small GTP-binding protein
VILLGNSGVGKTCIINRYVKNMFNDLSKSTIGVDCLNKLIQKEDLRSSSTSVDGNFKGEQINLQLWDTTGQESYRSINRIYYRGA